MFLSVTPEPAEPQPPIPLCVCVLLMAAGLEPPCCQLGKEQGGRPQAQSRKRWQAFFQRQAVHHWSRCSMPYTLRHFLASPRAFLVLL